MEMRPGDPAGLADPAERIARAQPLTRPRLDRAQMGIQRGHAVAVVDDHGTAEEEQIGLSQAHHAGRRGAHRRAPGPGDLEPDMGRPWLAVEDALAAVDAADRTRCRPGEWSPKALLDTVDRARRIEPLLLGTDALERPR